LEFGAYGWKSRIFHDPDRFEASDTELVIRNLIEGWSVEDFRVCLAEGLGPLALKGDWRIPEFKGIYSFSSFEGVKFEYEIDARRVWERFGQRAVLEGGVKGLMFENVELSITKRTKITKQKRHSGDATR
jgi:hypothetical protein